MTSVRVRADFDPTGLMIVSMVQAAARRAGLWRFGTITCATYFGIDVEPGASMVEVREAIGKGRHEAPLLSADLREAADQQ
ncbi:hypothetical protein ACFWBG_33205 [Nocardia salmonicida]|uniref:hypothetical protein n=1 Tax=Nocardia salmonicida TaxID=53431 RepID=UPI0036703513